MITRVQVRSAMRALEGLELLRGGDTIVSRLYSALRLYKNRGEYDNTEESAVSCLRRAAYEVEPSDAPAFVQGDRVKYIGPTRNGGVWITGKVYTVASVKPYDTTYIIQPKEHDFASRFVDEFVLAEPKNYGRKLPSWF